MKNIQKETAEAYQPLFDLMSKEHGLTLLVSEMDDIIEAVGTVNENINDVWRVKCDVEGCNETASSQGMYYRHAGYICLCSKHSTDARNDKSTPKLKMDSLEREERRKLNPNGYAA